MSRRRFPGFASSAAFAGSLLMASKGFAQGNANQAEALFHEGRAALDRGDLAVACAKLAESQQLDPAAGTLLNLGDCEERGHRTREQGLGAR